MAPSDPSLPPFLLTNPPPTPQPSQARLQALYASTSAQRISNPTGYSANITWWSDVIQETLRSGWINGSEGDRLVLKVDEDLVGRFDWAGKRPRGLGGLVEKDSTCIPPKLYPLPTYLSSLLPLHAPPSAAKRFIGRPLWWALSQLNPFGGEREVKEEELWKAYGKGKEYVHIPLVESAAAKFTDHLENNPILHYTESLYDVDTFRRAFGRVCISDPPARSGSVSKTSILDAREEEEARLSKKDVTVLLKWLARDVGAIVTDGTLIKVLQHDETALDSEITEVDRGVLSVLNALVKVEAQITSVEKQIAKCQAKAKSHLAASQKPLAMSQLRSKKALEDILVRRVGVSEQLRAVVRSIDEAQNDVDVMAAYETSTKSLKSLLSNPLLSPDRVEQTTEDLAETLASQREVDDAIRIGGAVAVGAGGDVDEGDLEDELAGLVEDEKTSIRQKEMEKGKQKEKEKEIAAEEARKKAEPTGPAPEQKKETPPAKPAKEVPSEDDEWPKRYEAAQAREREEKARAEAERLKRDEKRVMEVSQ